MLPGEDYGVPLLVPQRLDRVKRGGAAGRPEAEDGDERGL